MPVRFLALAASAFVLAGCASRLIAPDAVVAPPPTGLHAAAPTGLRVALEAVVGRDALGSWVREANWDEYRLAFSNDADGAVLLQSIELAGALPAPSVHTNSLAALDAQSLDNTRLYRSFARGYGIPSGIAGGSAVAVGGLAGAGIAYLALPAVAIGGTIYVLGRRRQDREDAARIEDELARRGLGLPATLPPRGALRGSAFFALAPGAQRMVVRYLRDGREHQLSLELPPPPAVPAGAP